MLNRFPKFVRDYSTAGFFMLLGIVAIVFSIFYLNFYNKTKNYPTTEAIVTKTELYEEEHYDEDTHYDATYTVYVEYTVDGKTYNEEYGIFPNMKKGDKVTVSYNPDKPEEVTQPASNIWLIGSIILSIISLMIACFSIIRTIKKNKKLKLQEMEWKHD